MAAAAKRKKSTVHLVSGSFYADVVTDSHADPPVHHWIVQREGSPKVVHWGQETTFEEAHRAAKAFLEELTERKKKDAC
ncbi:MAG: hypothetical protein ACR2IF_03190 [Terriglobales bacterium]